MTSDQLKQLLENINGNGSDKGSFSKCSARFNGSRRQCKVDEFIRTIEIYKDIEKISDANALKGLPLLFEVTVVTWWMGIKDEARTFKDALQLIRKHFASQKPAHRIYLDIFEVKQSPDIPTDTFICDKRALFSQLPEPKPTTSMQLDMIFGLLHISIRQNLRREDITTFNDLLAHARNAEILRAETNITIASSNTATTTAYKTKKRCEFCRRNGHELAECRKKKSMLMAKPDARPDEPKPRTNDIKCYGCGADGVYRSKCKTCNVPTKS